MKKWLLIGVGLVIVVVAVAVFYVVSSLDSLVVAAVEKFGSEITQTKVQLKEAKIGVTTGQGTLRGLNVGNPKDFKTDNSFRLGEITVELDTGTITQDPVIIKKIVIDSPEVTYELGPKGSNIDAIQKNVDAYMAQFKGKSSGQTKEKSSEGGGPKLVIQNLYVRNGKVNVSTTLLQGKKLGAPLPSIHLKDIGKEKGGASPGEIAEKVIGSIRQSTAKAVAPLGLDKLTGTLKKGLEGAAGTVGETTKGAAGAVGKGAEEAGKALKKLFGQ